jgi:hypothetical protein
LQPCPVFVNGIELPTVGDDEKFFI